MAYLRSEIRTEVRDLFYETTAELITDTQINRLINQELRSLPRKGVYNEEQWETDTEIDVLEYPLPDGTYKVEKVERNWGTEEKPDWEEIKGWDNYSNALYLPSRPTDVYTIRIHIRKSFTELSDDVTTTDVPTEKIELVFQGVLVRAYKMILGYLKNAKNWDAIAKPSGLSLNQIINVYKEAKEDYKDLLKIYKTYPLPREINLVG